MNIKDLLKTRNILVKNPNKKSKKDGQPNYVSVPITRENSGDVYTTFSKHMDDAYMFPEVEDPKKYNDYGITISRQNINNLDKQLADAQSNWEKIWHAITQSVVSEVGLGTLRAVSDLLDFTVGGVARAITGEDNTYTNPVSEQLQKWQEDFREAQPIYVDPDLNIANGGLFNIGWLAKGAPSVLSSLTLLIPGGGAVKAAGFLTKAAGVTKGVTKARKWLSGINKLDDASKLSKAQAFINNPITIARANKGVENIATALTMRTMENYQEASDVHVQTYQNALDKFNNMTDEEYNNWIRENKNILSDDIDTSNKDAVAKNIAKQAADRTFAMDFSNVLFDIIQVYDLKNVGKGIKQLSKNGGSRGVQKAKEELIQGAGELAGKTIDKTIKNGFFKKVTQYTGDIFKSTGKHLAIESTEGIEEGVNYIAQQEGLTFGTSLLDGKHVDYENTKVPDWLSWTSLGTANIINTWNNLQNPLSDYLTDPALYESAFWGLFGGMVFAGGGSALNRASLAMQRKAANKARKQDPITGETIETENDGGDDFVSLLELPETKAARVGLLNTLRKLEVTKATLQDIEDGKDVFGDRDEQGNLMPFTGDVETKKAIARNKVIQDFWSTVAQSALNSGTYNIHLDAFKSDEVREAMVKSGIISEDEAKDYQNAIVKKFEEVKDIHARQAAYILNQITAINAYKKNKTDIPLEYLQELTHQNVNRILNANSIEEQLNVVKAITAQEEADALKDLPDNEKAAKQQELQEQKEGVRLGYLISLYGRYSAYEKAIENSDLDDFEKASIIRKTKNEKNKVLEELAKTNLTFGTDSRSGSFGAIFAAIQTGSTFVAEEDGVDVFGNKKYKYTSNNNFRLSDAEVIKATREFFKNNDNIESISDETILQDAKEHYRRLVGATGKEGLVNSNKNLFDRYGQITELEYTKNLWLSSVANNNQQILENIDYLHNLHNKARSKIIADSEKVIREIYQKYDGINDEQGRHIEQAIIEAYNGNKEKAREIAEANLNQDDANKLLGALDVFNFSSIANDQIFLYIQNTIKKQRDIDSRKTAETDEDSNENSTTSENQNLGNRNQSKEELSQQTTETKRNSQNDQIMAINPQQTSSTNQNLNSDNRHKRNLKIITNRRGDIVDIKNSNNNNGLNIVTFDNEDGTFELDVKNLPRTQQLKLLTSELFDINDVNILNSDSNWSIETNPILRRNGRSYSVITPGTIKEDISLDTINQNLTDEDNQIIDEILKQDKDFTEEEISKTFNISELQAKKIAKAIKLAREQQEDTTTPVEDSNNTQQPTNSSTEEQTDNNNNNNEDIEQSTSSSTGGEITQNPENTSNETTNTSQNEANNEQLFNVIDQIFNDYIQNSGKQFTDPSLNLDDIADRISKQFSENSENNNYDIDVVNDYIAKRLQELKKGREEILKLVNPLDKTGATLAFAARREEIDNEDFSPFFKSAFDSFIKEYEKVIPFESVNGKKVIRLGDVLRICNNAFGTSDTSIATGMYDLIVKYLNSPNGKALYEVIDLDKGRAVINDINKTADEIQNEYDNTVSYSEQVNIAHFIEELNNSTEEHKERYYKIFNALKIGDKLTLSKSGKGNTAQLLLHKDDVIIGNMPVPRIQNDYYIIVNSGWNTDVKLDNNGKPISRSKDVILNLFLGNTVHHKELKSILTNYTLHNKNIDKLIEKFKENPLIKELIEDSINKRNNNDFNILFINGDTGTIDADLVLKYLANLWNYSTLSTIASDAATNNQIIINNIDRWFKKLYTTYNNVNNFWKNGEDTEVEISYINSGEILQAVYLTEEDNDVLDHYEELPFASEAIADFDNARVAFVDNEQKILVSNKNVEHIPGFKLGTTLLSVYGNNKYPSLVRSVGIYCNRNKESSLNDENAEINKIVTAIAKVISSSFANLRDNPNETSINNLKKTLTYLVSCSNNQNIIPIFRAIKGKFVVEDHINNGIKNGICLNYYANTYDKTPVKRLRIYFKDLRNRNIIGFSIKDDINPSNNTKAKYGTNEIGTAVNYLGNLLSELCQINISGTGIKTDNDTQPNTNIEGFITRGENNKLQVNIGESYNKEFDSYNDFLIKNNLIRVNTKKSENGTNFRNRGDNLKANQNLFVNLPIFEETTTTNSKPVSETKESFSDHVEKTSNKEVFDSVKTIIKENKTDVSKAIIKEVLGDELLNSFTSVATEFNVLDDILPTSILYDAYINDYDNNDNVRGAIAYTNGDGSHPTYTRYVNGVKRTGRIPVSEKTVVGPLFINMLSSLNINRRKQAIRKLIHEQLHVKLQEDSQKRNKLLEDIVPIYVEFLNNLNKDLATLDKNDPKYKVLNTIKKILSPYKGDRLFEEFLVESLTNKNFFDYLNSIKTDVGEIQTKDNLFVRIAKAIAKFFGWNIKDDSLYMKQLNIINEALSDDNTNNVDNIVENNNDTVTEDNTNNNNVETSKTDENNTNNSPTEDVFELADEDLQEFDSNDDDLDSFAANFEEVSEDSEGYTKLGNLDSFRNKLSLEVQPIFDKLVNTGWIEIKCK